MSTIDYRDVDRRFYEERLRGFLPKRLVDIHTHIWPAPRVAGDTASRLASWPQRIARVCPIEDLLETYRILLPDQAVTPLVFGNPTLNATPDELNPYVAEAAAEHGLPWLLLSTPAWSAEDLEARLAGASCCGVKVYLSYAPTHLATDAVTIFDFLPPVHLEALNRRQSVVMLHIPRSARLRDPENLKQMLEIEQRYPDVRLIIAHIGRAYCVEDIGDAFTTLGKTERMCFDISANTNAEVMARLLDAVGPSRVLFGTDLPIARMRMRRICENGRYINLVPRGLYGDTSADPHMRELGDPEAAQLSLFVYEILDALRRAAETVGLSIAEIEAVCAGNADRLL